MRRHLKHIVKFKTEEGIVIQRMKKAVRKNGRPFQAKKTVQSLLPQQTEALNLAGNSRKATLWHTFGLFSAAIFLS